MVSDRDHFSTYSEVKCNIKLADGKSSVSPGIRMVYLKTKSGKPLKLECLHVPHLVGNLIFEGRLFRCRMDEVRTGPLTASLMNKGQTLFKVKLSDDKIVLMKFEVVKKGKSFLSVKLSNAQSNIEILNRNTGHPSNKSLRKIFDLLSDILALLH